MAPPKLPITLHAATITAALQQRICPTKYAGSEPGFRASISGRFDDPLGVFETLYCAPTFDICYSETLVRDDRFSIATSRYEIPRPEHDARSLSLLLIDFAKLKVVDLYGIGLQLMGLNKGHTGGNDYDETQALARAIYDHPDKPDGMVYTSRFAVGSQQAIVLFDRAKPHVQTFPGRLPIELKQIPQAFDALSQLVPIALV